MAEAPFGDKVSERIPFYHRAAPMVATAGPLGRLGIIEAKGVGFRSVVNLGPSTAAAGLDDASMAAYANLGYFGVPLAGDVPTPAEVGRLRQIVEAPENGPILIYGMDRDQAAASWALLRADTGVPPALALQEGLTAGLRGRLGSVEERLGVETSKRASGGRASKMTSQAADASRGSNASMLGR
jgi:hypothetical protein